MLLVEEHLTDPTPGQQQGEQIYHINLLKRWVEPANQLAAFAIKDTAVVDLGTQLSAAQKKESDVFPETPGWTAILSHEIHTPPETTIRQRPYWVPEARRQAIEEKVQWMLHLGVIEESRSPWSSPIVMVPKKDGSYRFCNDFRKLNEVSRFNSYPTPQVDEMVEPPYEEPASYQRLTSPKVIGKCHCLKMPEKKTAFSTPGGHWQYRALPFGLHGAAATFQRLMDIVLRPHWAYTAEYIDDVVIHSEHWEYHLDQLKKVLMELRKVGLTANPKKCHLGLLEAQYLGYSIGRGLIKPQDRSPHRPDQERAAREGTLDRRSGASIPSTQDRSYSFTNTACSRLQFPLHRTDIFDVGIEAVLSQVQAGEEHPIVYISRKLSPAESRYAAIEKEALAIKWADQMITKRSQTTKFQQVPTPSPLHSSQLTFCLSSTLEHLHHFQIVTQ
ncbi:Retrovirus-related Pol polyprotein [Labeo rohita]|uniref:ribonuclease H n=1 Tax=Labeo rohita TaxID=84645 RepID=A0ABQ8MWY2_LABRO|nr:Retrovirus-related Pol polyprotein [Labeo rohita]